MPIRFGFLPYKQELNFHAGKIVPVPEFDKGLKFIRKRVNDDGYLYPPRETALIIDSNDTRTVPTKRPAHLFPLPPSHELRITYKPEPNIREGSAGFIIHFLAFLFGTRLQFDEWAFDGRVPIVMLRGVVVAVTNRYQVERSLDQAFKTWATWSELEQRRFTNILYMFSRTSVYQWDWEQFIVQAMVLDALWKMGEQLFCLRANGYENRLRVLCAHFSYDVENWIDVREMVRLRNDLFHETLWHGARPSSTAGKPTEGRPYYIFARMSTPIKTLIAKFLQIP
ncbi:MAG: hypothetical protein ACREFF_13135 [Candidatus Udaeobacter sp.]